MSSPERGAARRVARALWRARRRPAPIDAPPIQTTARRDVEEEPELVRRHAYFGLPTILSSSQPTVTLTSQTTIVAPTYVQKPSIEKSGVSHSASASMRTLIAKYASPNVTMISGSVRIARIGLMIVLPIVRISRRREERSPAADRHAVEHPVDDDQREDVDAVDDEEPDPQVHRRSSRRSYSWDIAARRASGASSPRPCRP